MNKSIQDLVLFIKALDENALSFLIHSSAAEPVTHIRNSRRLVSKVLPRVPSSKHASDQQHGLQTPPEHQLFTSSNKGQPVDTLIHRYLLFWRYQFIQNITHSLSSSLLQHQIWRVLFFFSSSGDRVGSEISSAALHGKSVWGRGSTASKAKVTLALRLILKIENWNPDKSAFRF